MIPGSAWASPKLTALPPLVRRSFFCPHGKPAKRKGPPRVKRPYFRGLLVGALSRICGKVIRGQATEGSRLETLTCAVAEG